jgi:cytochrome bd ubiquinol oxidase subunit I
MGPSGFISLLAGWITTEAGRQPWVVYGMMRTADAVSPVTAQEVGVTLLAFVAVYLLVFGTGIYYMLKLARSVPAVSGNDEASGASLVLEHGAAPLAVPARAAAVVTRRD